MLLPDRANDLPVCFFLPGGGVEQTGLGVGTGGGTHLDVGQAALQQHRRRQHHQDQQRGDDPGGKHDDAHAHLGHVDEQGLVVQQQLSPADLGTAVALGMIVGALLASKVANAAGSW